MIVTPGDIHLASLLSDLGRVTHRRADCSVSAMVPDCSTSAENDGEHRGLFSASSDRVEVAGHQLGPVSAVPEGGVEAENVDAGQYEQVGFLVNQSGVADGD